MLSNKQFTDALSFVRSYKDALDCVEQIAERRAAYTHYENFSRAVVEGIQNNQVIHTINNNYAVHRSSLRQVRSLLGQS